MIARRSEASLEPAAPSTPHAQKPLLLVVDDDAGVRETYRLILDKEFVVLEAANGETAITTVRTQRIDLVILDVLIPGVDGIEVLQQLKALVPNLPVIMVTAMRTVRSAVISMKLGALDYLTKPFDEEELRATIHRALDQRARRPLAHSDDSLLHQDAQEWRPHRILVVGGDLGWRAVLAVALQRFGRVELAAAISLGLNRAFTLLPTCVILRGNPSSPEVARFIRAVHARQPACVSFVVGDNLNGDTISPADQLTVRGVIGSPADIAQVVHHVAQALGATTQSETRRLRFSQSVSRTLNHVGQHYGERLTIQDLAKTVGTSASRLSHLFTAETAMTAMDYLLKVRVVAAQELLAHTTQKVEHIAASVGFFDASHLARSFRRIIGSTPRAYRRSAS